MSDNVQLHLYVDQEDASSELMEALQNVQVTRGEKAPSTFALTFHASRQDSDSDFPIIDQLQPFTRISMAVTVDGSSSMLFDGYITQQQLAPAFGPQGTTFTVSGEDVSVKMALFEFSLEYPSMGDFLIVEAVLVKYLAFSIFADVKPTIADIIPFDYVPQQVCTDRDYLLQLAQKNGYRFYVTPGPKLGHNTAYWGPPKLSGTSQRALNVDMGPFTNVESISFSMNQLAPTMTYGAVQQDFIPPIPIPVFASTSTRSPELSENPVLDSFGGSVTNLLMNPLAMISEIFSMKVRGSLFQHQGLGVLQAWQLAQAKTDDSTDEVVTVKGQLSTSRYGAVLDAPGIVEVRGAGESYNGKYYVKEVTHQMGTVQGNWKYQQSFTLTREGTGSTVKEVTDHVP